MCTGFATTISEQRKIRFSATITEMEHFMKFKKLLRDYAVKRLEAPLKTYETRMINNMEKLVYNFGDEADYMVIEAFASTGVITEPISKYQNYNFRICRPYGISPPDLHEVIAEVVDNLDK
jgi:hypothetical protein